MKIEELFIVIGSPSKKTSRSRFWWNKENFIRKTLFFYPIVYFSSTIEAPLHTLQDACIVDIIKQSELNDFKFDCDYIKLWNLWNIAPIYFFELISRKSESNTPFAKHFDMNKIFNIRWRGRKLPPQRYFPFFSMGDRPRPPSSAHASKF